MRKLLHRGWRWLLRLVRGWEWREQRWRERLVRVRADGGDFVLSGDGCSLRVDAHAAWHVLGLRDGGWLVVKTGPPPVVYNTRGGVFSLKRREKLQRVAGRGPR